MENLYVVKGYGEKTYSKKTQETNTMARRSDSIEKHTEYLLFFYCVIFIHRLNWIL